MTELWQFEIKSVTYGRQYTYPVTFKSNSKSYKVDLANLWHIGAREGTSLYRSARGLLTPHLKK